MDEKARQDMIDSLRRKVWGLRGLADLMAFTYGIDEGKEIGYSSSVQQGLGGRKKHGIFHRP